MKVARSTTVKSKVLGDIVHWDIAILQRRLSGDKLLAGYRSRWRGKWNVRLPLQRHRESV